jgi:ADP-heptose:LPS heptosyltransferase
LGDHLITVPIYKRLRSMYKDDRLVLICNVPAKGNSKLVGPTSFLPPTLFDEWHHYPVGSNLRAALETFFLLRGLRLDELIYLMPRRTIAQGLRDRLFFWLARVPLTGLRIQSREQRPRPIVGSQLVEHESDRLARLVGLEIEKTPRDLSIDITDAERSEAAALLGDEDVCTIAVNIGGKLDIKDWGVDKWSALITELAAISGIERLILLGAADEFDYSERLRQLWPRSSHNFCGRLAPRLSAAVLAKAQLFVGHDSGPMHLASAVGVPVVAIFCSRDLAGHWFPLGAVTRVHYTKIDCMGCGKLRCDDLKKECIRRIAVSEVRDSCVTLLRQASKSPLAA